MESRTINGLAFVQTCSACPEQYDVFRGEEQVGYVRLRWGYLRAEYLVDMQEVYSYEFEDAMKGAFYEEEERQEHLINIADSLLERINNEKLCDP